MNAHQMYLAQRIKRLAPLGAVDNAVVSSANLSRLQDDAMRRELELRDTVHAPPPTIVHVPHFQETDVLGQVPTFLALTSTAKENKKWIEKHQYQPYLQRFVPDFSGHTEMYAFKAPRLQQAQYNHLNNINWHDGAYVSHRHQHAMPTHGPKITLWTIVKRRSVFSVLQLLVLAAHLFMSVPFAPLRSDITGFMVFDLFMLIVMIMMKYFVILVLKMIKVFDLPIGIRRISSGEYTTAYALVTLCSLFFDNEYTFWLTLTFNIYSYFSTPIVKLDVDVKSALVSETLLDHIRQRKYEYTSPMQILSALAKESNFNNVTYIPMHYDPINGPSIRNATAEVALIQSMYQSRLLAFHPELLHDQDLDAPHESYMSVTATKLPLYLAAFLSCLLILIVALKYDRTSDLLTTLCNLTWASASLAWRSLCQIQVLISTTN